MTNALDKQLHILLIDKNLARIEHLENLLYRHNFLVHTLSPDELERGDNPNTFSLVLTYLPLNPAWKPLQGIPMLVVLPDDISSETGPSRGVPPDVIYLPAAVSPSVVADKIIDILRPEEAEPV